MILSGEFHKQPKPKRLASVVKAKTRRAVGIAVVGFVGDHLKDKKRQNSTHWTNFYLKVWDF